MCVIVYKKAGTKISKESVIDCWETNPHGFGAWIDGKVVKGIMSLPDCLKFCRDIGLIGNKGRDKTAVLHFRIASRGEINPRNCHPFRTKYGYLFHNGTLCFADKKTSDTKQLADLISCCKTRHQAVDLLHLTNNRWNRFCLASSKHGIYAPDLGLDWLQDRGVWYSNGNHQRSKLIPALDAHQKAFSDCLLSGWSEV